MAILRPPITKVGNRHYRKLVFEGGQFNDPSNNDGTFITLRKHYYALVSIVVIG